MATVRKRPSLASAMKPASRARRLSVPMKFVTMFADLEVEIWRSPTKYVTKFIDMPITHTLSDSSDPIHNQYSMAHTIVSTSVWYGVLIRLVFIELVFIDYQVSIRPQANLPYVIYPVNCRENPPPSRHGRRRGSNALRWRPRNQKIVSSGEGRAISKMWISNTQNKIITLPWFSQFDLAAIAAYRLICERT